MGAQLRASIPKEAHMCLVPLIADTILGAPVEMLLLGNCMIIYGSDPYLREGFSL